MTEQQHAAGGPQPGAAAGPGTSAGGSREPGGAGGAHGSTGADGTDGAGGVRGAGEAGGARRAGEAAQAKGALDGLYRVREQKMLGGVCAGLGRHYQLDPVIFRIVLAVLSLTGGLGLIFYGFVWLFVPLRDEEENEARRLLSGRVDGPALTAVLFALVGCALFLSVLGNQGVLRFGASVALLLAGAAYWSRRRGWPDPDPSGGRPMAVQAVADAPPEAKAPPVPASFVSWWREPIVKDGTHVGGTGYLWGPKDLHDLDKARDVARTSRWDVPHPPQRPTTRGEHWIGGWVFLLALLAGATGTALTWDDAALGSSLQIGLAAALAVFGTGIGVSALLGRTGAGSIMLAVITAALLAATSALPKNITTDWIHTTWHPPAAARVHPHYTLGSGDGTLDLSHIHLADGRTLKSRADIGAGRLRVVVPRDATVRLRIEVGLGDIQLPGDDRQDVDVAPGKEKKVTLHPTGGRTSGGTVDLRLKVGIGQVEVTRAAA